MEKCLVCFQAVETDIFVPPDECVKLFNNFLVSLHSSIAEKNEMPFVAGGEFPFCKMCFDSAFQLNQINEQLSAIQKQLSDLTVEFSLSVLYRRSLTTTHTVENQNSRNKPIQKMIEINVSGLPHKLFSFNTRKNRCEDENTVEDVIPTTVIAVNPNEVDIETPNYHHEIESDVNDGALLEYPSESEHEHDDLFIFPTQNPVETENMKFELNYDNICDSNAITDSNTLVFSCPPETDDDANCFIDNIIAKQDDNSTTDLGEVEYENDPLCSAQHESREENKSIEIERHSSSKRGHNETKTETQLLTFDRIPCLILKRLQLDQIGVAKKAGRRNLLKPKVKKKTTISRSNYSPGKSDENYTFKRLKRAKKVQGPSICEFCNKAFTSSYRMKEHKRMHTGERPFQCPFCPNAFKRPQHLTDHKLTHTGERPYKCHYCSKKFSTRSARRLHQLTHPGSKRYKCNVCLKGFNEHSTWEKHLKFCHPKEVQLDQIGVAKAGQRNLLKPKVKKKTTIFRSNYSPGESEETNTFKRLNKRAKKLVKDRGACVCEFCNKAFQDHYRMEEHKRIHTGERPFQCPFCSKAFKQPTHLRDHKLTHTGERPYKCQYCSKKFRQGSARRLHQLTHPGGKRYKCNLCLKSFNAKSTWQKHLPFCRHKEHE